MPGDAVQTAPDVHPEPAATGTSAGGSCAPSHLLGPAAEALRWSTEERIAFLRTDRWIPYPRAKQALARANDLIADPRIDRPRGMLLLGRPGNGKSTILKRLMHQHRPEIRTDGHLTCSLVCMQMSPGASESSFWSDILEACAVAHRPTDSWRQKRAQAIAVMTSLQPRAIVIDETNELAKGTPRDQGLVLGEIKWLSNHLRAPLILAGTEVAATLMDSDPQLARRFGDVILDTWKRDDPDLAALLDTFEAILPLPERSHLSSPPMIDALHDLHDGTIGSIAAILRQAATIAITQSREKINLKILKQITPDSEQSRREQRHRRL